ncbi:ER membrane protein complex subunit 1 isoform X3 [Plutella xylostella]|uniref:ER membrane protein complex subunit 1 isoform X1 n=1 Tax=Plutella xylostella TaxID=51655 RepID=UPI0020331C4F|nr:ER membrane protein complex subunit 1 isoform X1 [Plutella xylostella]XP_048477546.1 ER membrane protein complex subunit 1 isoform X2 [Plutella xylostella]XP_048477547.1 ER membrane protein complex subunit 1 isoform X3 [Plutella xylostella]
MGVLSSRLKSSFLDLLKFLNNLHWLIILFSLFNLSVCIYEDQIGKFDWRQSYVGRIKFAQYDTTSTAKKIIVATEENVIAALNLKTGEVLWRHVLETASRGNIQMLHVSDKRPTFITVSGNTSPYVVRKWSSNTGILLWEMPLTLNTARPELARFFVEDDQLIQVAVVPGARLELALYNVMRDSDWKKQAAQSISAEWTNENCVISIPNYICVSGNQVHIVNVKKILNREEDYKPLVKPLSEFEDLQTFEGGLKPLVGSNKVSGFILDNKKLILIQHNTLVAAAIALSPGGEVASVDAAAAPALLQTWHQESTGVQLTATCLTTFKKLPEVSLPERALATPEPEVAAAMCTGARDQLACRFLLLGADDSVTLVTQAGRVLWTREEALANVVKAEMVDLPVSEEEAAIETEFNQKEGSIWLAFSRRLEAGWLQLLHLARDWPRVGDAGAEGTGAGQGAGLVKDYFNLHKIILAVTEVGKIFGIDSLTGDIVWSRFEPQLDTSGALIFVRRPARHRPFTPYVTVLGKHSETGNGLLISFNPITGSPTGERVLHLDTPLLQAALLHQPDREQLHALLLLDRDENVLVLPRSSAPLVRDMYMYVAHTAPARVHGYALQYDGQSVTAQRTWSLSLGGPTSRLACAAPTRPERAQSAGRVLADRTVLYKHLDPNAVLFVLQDGDSVVATVVDVVSGGVVAAQAHRRARATPHALYMEHFLAYLYHNEKQRRTEIATMELYEGSTRRLDSGTPFSSLNPSGAVHIARQSYVLGAGVVAAALTRTPRLITDKHALLALSTGAVIEMPWAYLDPRRPLSPTPEQREEGLIPYAPELPLPAENVLNYNRTLTRVHGIYTAPADLESISLVFVTGLDLFYTRVAPSKTFDLLKEDFDYYLILLVLGALVAATYSTKYFASRKMLRQAWK